MAPRQNASFDVIDPMSGSVVQHLELAAGEQFQLTGAEALVLKGTFTP